MSTIRTLPLDSINILAGTQSRAELNEATVDEYADALRQGAEFPPVVVFSDGADGGNWLADGFHRFHGHRAAGLAEIACDVRPGTMRDAKLFSFGANATHGLPRTNADKRRSVEAMLADPEWSSWTQGQIAMACRVSREFVSRVSTTSKPSCDRSQDTVTVVRGGQTYEMKTAQIGKAAPVPAAPSSPPAARALSAAVPPLSISPNSATAAVRTLATAALAPLDGEHEQPPEDDTVAQLWEDFAKVREERDSLLARVGELESLVSQHDLAAEALKWKTNFEALSGRNKGLTTKLNVIEPEADAMRKTLKQIRQVLGVERNQDIVPALKERSAA